MSLIMQESFDGRVLMILVREKLSKADYETFGPEFDRLVEKHGKVRVLFEMQDFHGWTAGALWEDVKVDFRHFNHVERLAFVGDKKWEKGMSYFCKPFTTAEIRYFDRLDSQAATDWIEEGMAVESH